MTRESFLANIDPSKKKDIAGEPIIPYSKSGKEMRGVELKEMVEVDWIEDLKILLDELKSDYRKLDAINNITMKKVNSSWEEFESILERISRGEAVTKKEKKLVDEFTIALKEAVKMNEYFLRWKKVMDEIKMQIDEAQGNPNYIDRQLARLNSSREQYKYVDPDEAKGSIKGNA